MSQYKEFTDQSRGFRSRFERIPQQATIEYTCRTDAEKEQVLLDIQSARIILPKRLFAGLEIFLDLKRKHGTEIERQFYTDTITDVKKLVLRLVSKRPAAFWGGADRNLLRDGVTRVDSGFEKIGTPDEESPLVLSEYLSYDEMMLSALIGVSNTTFFFNNGTRYNFGDLSCENARETDLAIPLEWRESDFTRRGVIVGLVGARFERPEVMESRLILLQDDVNTAAKGYGKGGGGEVNVMLEVFKAVYEVDSFPTIEEATEASARHDARYVDSFLGYLFDLEIYKKRIALTIEVFLLEANLRAKEAGKKAYVHLVGLGLGVWQVASEQIPAYVDACHDVVKSCHLRHIDVIDFAWISAENSSLAHVESIQSKAGNSIGIVFSKRNPADPLPSPSTQLLVASYAWDSNALPGNEYWEGYLDASGDPAAACSCPIAEIQNAAVNARLADESCIFLHADAEDEEA